MKRFFIVALLLMLSALLAGCNSDANIAETDIPAIVTIGPAITEVVAELGLGGQIIAHDSHSAGIAGIATGLPQLDMMGLDAEAILAMSPDIVLISAIVPGGADVANFLSNSGINAAIINTAATIDGIFNFIFEIARHVDAEDKFAAISAALYGEITEISAIAGGISPRRTVYFEIEPAPDLFTFGYGTFLHELLETIGAVNVFGHESGWISIADEAILAANPDVILTNVDWSGHDEVAQIAARPGWTALDAVQNGRIYVIDRDATSRANHNVVYALRQMARAVYPEYFE